MEGSTKEELELKLSGYREKLAQVERVLARDPSNAAVLKIKSDLQDVINLTEDLLKLKTQPASPIAIQLPTSPPRASSPPVLRTQIFKNGEVVSAQYTEDKLWYDAVIDSFNPQTQMYRVTFIGYGNSQDCTVDELRPKGAHAAKKEKKQTETLQISASGVPIIPKHLQIHPEDPAEVRQAKKKKIHALKSKLRRAELEQEQNNKAESWKSFLSTHGRKKESMFKSPDAVQGKVGVIGSGQGVTPIPERIKPQDLPGKKPVLTLPPTV